MQDISIILKHYKRQDVQNEIILAAKDREVGIRYKDKGFGKRPDVLLNPADILVLAKQGATSFHVSEERWINPLQISTGLKKKELDELRYGWDLVLDIDCPVWEYSKLITHLLIKALDAHGIKHISCKFSGNKGFHVGVPFEVFPEKINDGIKTTTISSWFPDGPKNVVLYLMHYIDSVKTGFELSKTILKTDSLQDVAEKLGKTAQEISANVCLDCEFIIKTKVNDKKEDKKNQESMVCPSCQNNIKILDKEFIKCERCGNILGKHDIKSATDRRTDKDKMIKNDSTSCPKCGSRNISSRINPEHLIDVDTVLISSRHLYRCVYSLHEKSMLASVPIDPKKILEFKKEMASPETLNISRHRFLEAPRQKIDEASRLFNMATEWWYNKENEKNEQEKFKNKVFTSETLKSAQEFVEFEEKVPVELFPPCILKILKGVEDGRKRSMFILLNFLRNVGWDYESIEELMAEWNKKNQTPLSETLLKGHIRYHKQNKKKVLPPNCDNKSYYKDLHICCPDNLCQKVKNPVNYTRRKAFSLLKRPRKENSDSDKKIKTAKDSKTSKIS